MKALKGGLEGTDKWRITIDVFTARPPEVIKMILKALEENGVRHDMIDFHRV